MRIALFEYDECLAFCPVLHLLSIALADNAIVGFQSADAVYKATLQDGAKPLRFRWRADMMDKPVFRKDKHGRLEDGPMRYHSISYDWRRLIELAGFRDPAPLYSLRRGCGNALNGRLHLFILLV